MAPTARGSYSSGRARREKILDAAQARFADGGYSRTTITDIARDVGMTAPGLKHHFPSKEDLLLGVQERRFERALDTAASAAVDEDGLGVLRLMLHQVKLRSQQPELMQQFVMVAGFAADPSTAAHRLFASRYARVVDRLTADFERAVAAGFLRADLDYRALASEFIAVSDGLQLQAVLLPEDTDMVGAMRVHLERVAASILPAGACVARPLDDYQPALMPSID